MDLQLHLLDATAAGDIWDNFDGTGDITPTGVGTGDNMFNYSLPTIADGLAVNVSYLPTGSAAQSAVGYSATYSGVDGLSVSYGAGDGTNDTTDATDESILCLWSSYSSIFKLRV